MSEKPQRQPEPKRRAEDQHGIRGWLAKPARRVYVGVLFLFLCGLIAFQSYTFSKVIEDEHSTCKIQARGLPAGHELAASMREIHSLLTLTPTSKAQKLAAKNTPSNVKVVVFNLNWHLQRYLKAEAKQPTGRSC